MDGNLTDAALIATSKRCQSPSAADHLSTTHIVVPTYNEAENLPALYRRLRQTAGDVYLVVVDDASPDGTADVARRFAAGDRRVHVIERQSKAGYGSAHREGMAYALAQGAEVVVTMDADLSHDPESLPPMLAALQTHDVVIGSRYVPGGTTPGWPRSRALLSRTGNRFIRGVLGIRVRDCTGGFRCYRAEAVRRAKLLSTTCIGYSFNMECLYRCVLAGLRIVELPIAFAERTCGESKLSLGIAAESLVQALRLRLQRRGLSRRLLHSVDTEAGKSLP